jgi:hypothetical protein
MTQTLQGTVRGNTIVLAETPGFADGQAVEIVVRVLVEQPGSGLLRTEGALADDADWDRIMDEVRQTRKLERRPATDPA